MSDGVKVDVSLGQVRRQLRQVAPEVDKGARRQLSSIAAGVRAKVRAAIPRRSGRARLAVTSGVDSTSAYVKERRDGRYVYVPWLDFGGTLKPVGGRYNTIARPVLRDGRYLYPIAGAEHARAKAECERVVRDAVRTAGLD